MTFNKNFFIGILCLLLNLVVFAQNTEKIYWTVDNDLLPQNSVKSIVPDKYGYIWLTTENGLVRYDGKSYVIYNSQNLDIKSNRMLYIQGNSQSDSLFVTTDMPEDLILIHKRKARKVNRKNIKTDLIYLKSGDKIYNSYGKTPYSLDLKEWSYRILLPSRNYYLVKFNSIEYYSSKKKLLKKIPFENAKTKLLFSIGEKLFYLRDNQQYAVINKGEIKWKSYNFEISENYRILWNKPLEQLFILSDETLLSIKENNDHLQSKFVLKDNSLKYSNVISILNDYDKNIIFLGSSTNGLGICKLKRFHTISIQDDNQSSIFYASEKFTDKTIITSKGLEISKDSVVKNFKFKNNEKTTMALDANKNIWYKSGYELFFHEKNDDYKKLKKWRFHNRIGTFLIDSNKKGWLTVEQNNQNRCRLLYFYPHKNTEFRSFTHFDFCVNYISENKEGNLWLAGTKGLYILDPKKNILKHINGTAHLNIRSILETENNEVWIATYGQGFYLYKDKKLYRFPLDKNKYLATTHYFMEDHKGFLWIPTNKGLFQVKKDVLLASIKNPQQPIYYHYYNKESGFLTNEFNGGSLPYSSQIGSRFFLPSMNGMVTFDTETIRNQEPKNPIYIDKILVDNKNATYSDDVLQLPKNYQRVIFSFSSPYFENELNTSFEVKLDGPSNIEWTAVSSDNKYSFTKLSAGTYTLTARKLSGFDSQYIYKKINIEIAPRIYETFWFKVLMFFISGFLIILGLKFYLNNVKRRNKILVRKIAEKTTDLHNTIRTLRATKESMKKQADKNNKLIQIISHDIKSPLKFMSMASKYMYEEFDPNSPDLKDNILAMYTSSSQIYNFLDNILSYSKVNNAEDEIEDDHFLLYNEINEKTRLFKSIAIAVKTQFKNIVSNTLYLKTNQSLFAIILHNLLDNALKHTIGGVIEFSAVQEEMDIFITIKDNGRGMNYETLFYYQSVIEDFDLNKNKSNSKLGLHLVIELMLILNGKITIDSADGKGTTVVLQFSNQTEKKSS